MPGRWGQKMAAKPEVWRESIMIVGHRENADGSITVEATIRMRSPNGKRFWCTRVIRLLPTEPKDTVPNIFDGVDDG